MSKELFYTLYDYNNIRVLYATHTNFRGLKQQLMDYSKSKLQYEKLYILFHSTEQTETTIKGIELVKSDVDYAPFFVEHAQRKDPLRGEDESQIKNIYDALHIPFTEFEDKMKPAALKLIPYVSAQIDILKKNAVIDYQLNEGFDYEKLKVDFFTFLQRSVPVEFDYESFFDIYPFQNTHRLRNTENNIIIELENVYYKNKKWYDKNKKPLKIPEFEKDVEYRQFTSMPHADISKCSAIEINEPVLYLDYVYDFYNFGEFWDIVKRLMLNKDKLPIFGLDKNKVSNIDYYFKTIGYTYPPKYKYSKDKLFYFKKIRIVTICGTARGVINKWNSFHMNQLFNKSSLVEQGYNIYLTRGTFGRSIIDEQKIIETLKTKYNFIILNGSETLEQLQYYFTNAKLILGIHGSLMKNMVWCKKNPIFIEFCPYTRANFDIVGNAITLNMKSFFFVCQCDTKEQIYLTEMQLENLYKLLDIIVI